MTNLYDSLIVTDQDRGRLHALLLSHGDDQLEFLEEELSRAMVVPQVSVPPDVVTMNSVVTYLDTASGVANQVAIVYPNNAQASEGRVSVLAPIGAALLGLRVGQEATCPIPNGSSLKLKVLAVSFQPESLGAYDL